MILITGANGQLGSELKALSLEYPDQYLFASRADLDISSPKAIQGFFEENDIDFCINCAAYTAVDQAESDIENAYKINETAVGNLAKSCAKQDVVLIHISTDYVFHHLDKSEAYKTDDEVFPQGIYAKSKLAGEQVALKENPKTLVIRTSWLYSSFGKNFVKTMLRLSKDRDSLNVVNDQVGSPTYARDLARTILVIIQQLKSGEKEAYGLYHYSNQGACSWFEFAKEIFHLSTVDCEVSPIPGSQYPSPAKRPPFSVLDCSKIQIDYQIEIPNWKVSLQDCLKELA